MVITLVCVGATLFTFTRNLTLIRENVGSKKDYLNTKMICNKLSADYDYIKETCGHLAKKCNDLQENYNDVLSLNAKYMERIDYLEVKIDKAETTIKYLQKDNERVKNLLRLKEEGKDTLPKVLPIR